MSKFTWLNAKIRQIFIHIYHSSLCVCLFLFFHFFLSSFYVYFALFLFSFTKQHTIDIYIMQRKISLFLLNSVYLVTFMLQKKKISFKRNCLKITSKLKVKKKILFLFSIDEIERTEKKKRNRIQRNYSKLLNILCFSTIIYCFYFQSQYLLFDRGYGIVFHQKYRTNMKRQG